MGVIEQILEVLREINRGIQFLVSQTPKRELMQVTTIEACAKLLKMERSYLDQHLHDPGFPLYAEGTRMRRLIPWEVLEWMKAKALKQTNRHATPGGQIK